MMTLTQHIASCLILADLSLLALLFNYRTRRWVLMGYLAAVVPAYLIGEVLLGRTREWWQPGLWGMLTLAVAIETCWLALEGSPRRRLILIRSLCFGFVLAGIALWGGIGYIRDYKTAYRILTTSVWVAMGACAVVWVYCLRKGCDPAPGFVAAYFAADALIAPVYRMMPWAWAAPRLNVMVHAWHLAVVLTATASLTVRGLAKAPHSGSRIP